MSDKKLVECIEDNRPEDGKKRKTKKAHYSEKGSHKARGEFWKAFKDKNLNQR